MLWDLVVGSQLEELLFGLLEAMGATELVWRAGTTNGVSAPDGGRDLEATFVHPTPDGELERSLWWIESKGRDSTVAKADVVASVMNAAGTPDLDVLVFCTNSRFSNPTRDWVSEWQKNHPRPKIRLWDRDRLIRLVREHPIVTARVLPEALEDSQRLQLLVDRFTELGETPNELDLEYFWAHQSVVVGADAHFYAIAMFAYSETDHGLTERPWGSLIPDGMDSARTTLILVLAELPRLIFREKPRPLSNSRVVEIAAYMILQVIIHIPAKLAYKILTNPGQYLKRPHPLADLDDERAAGWRDMVTLPMLERIKDELASVCASDCVRVSVDPYAFPPPLTGERYWRRFGVGKPSDERVLIIQSPDEPCAVGLNLTASTGCPLVEDIELSEKFIEQLQAIIRFRHKHPDGQFLKLYNRTKLSSILPEIKDMMPGLSDGK